MAFKNWLNGITGVDEGEPEVDNINYTNNEVIEEKDNSSNKMILLEPRAYSESQQIADYLKSNSSVVVNLKRVTPDQAKRIVDFLSGTLYAIDGGLQKLGGGIFLCTPHDVNVEGTISDETAKPKTKDKDDDDFNW